MAQFPSLPLFTDAYLADTMHLTDAQHGIYLKLLILTWRSPECRLPNDNDWLALRLQRPVKRVVSEVRPLLSEFYSSTGNWLFQKRLLKEWRWCQRRSKQQSDIAKSAWDKRKTYTGAIPAGNARTIPNGNAGAIPAGNAPYPTHKERKEPSQGKEEL